MINLYLLLVLVDGKVLSWQLTGLKVMIMMLLLMVSIMNNDKNKKFYANLRFLDSFSLPFLLVFGTIVSSYICCCNNLDSLL